MKLFQFESYKKGIVLSTIFNILNKGLVFLSSLIVAYYFGAQLRMDIYFYAYNVVVIISTFITSLNASVLIPESMRLRTRERNLDAMRFLNYFIYLYLVLTLVVVFIFLIQPVNAFRFLSDFHRDALYENEYILLVATPLILLMPVVNLLTDILTSYRFFSISMLAGIVNGFFTITFIIFGHASLDVFSLLFGLLFSYTLNLFFLVYLMKKKLQWSFAFKKVNIEKRVWKNIGFAQAGNITSSLTVYAPLYLLSGFGNGIITSLNFANQISFLPTNLITNQFSAIAGIKFNELHAQSNHTRLNQVFLTTASFLIFVLAPISGIYFIYSHEIVSVLLERGAFKENGVYYTAQFLQYLGLLIPMYVINTLFSRLFMATHKIMESFWYQIIFNVVLIICLYFAIKEYGFVAYPITLVLVHLLNVLLCYILEKKYFDIINYGKLLKNFLYVVLINMSVGALVYLLARVTAIESKLIAVVFGGMVYVVLVAIAGIVFRLDETFNNYLNIVLQRRKGYGRN